MELERRPFWILTWTGPHGRRTRLRRAARRLRLRPKEPILQQIAEAPETKARALLAQLDEIELALARRARAAGGAHALLQRLSRAARLGIVSRNSFANAVETLRACELARFFAPECVLGREAAAPKPDPEGIRRLLAHWRAEPHQAVMVGDYRYDLLAGRAAGTATVYVDFRGGFEFAEHADVAVGSLAALAALLP